MRRVIGSLVVALAAWVWAGPAQAIFLDHARTVEVNAKVLGQMSLRMENSDTAAREAELRFERLVNNAR